MELERFVRRRTGKLNGQNSTDGFALESFNGRYLLESGAKMRWKAVGIEWK